MYPRMHPIVSWDRALPLIVQLPLTDLFAPKLLLSTVMSIKFGHIEHLLARNNFFRIASFLLSLQAGPGFHVLTFFCIFTDHVHSTREGNASHPCLSVCVSVHRGGTQLGGVLSLAGGWGGGGGTQPGLGRVLSLARGVLSLAGGGGGYSAWPGGDTQPGCRGVLSLAGGVPRQGGGVPCPAECTCYVVVLSLHAGGLSC